ncbi:scaffold attachment factor B1 [Rhinoderma darwinii]|uniref:scaffold attachment factor B1 n=1 Tax=Rhinoderma darwinii TaxID=43563 RepID=UPI003F66393F
MADEQPSPDAGANTEVETKKLSELRVIDLKAELKKRNLDTGGNKSALTERLKKAIEEEGGNTDEIQLTTDTPTKKTPKRSGRVQKQEEVDDNGVEDDSGDSQENEETSPDQENEKVLEILGENDKCEQLKEEVPEVQVSVDQEDSCVEPEKPKEEEEVFVTIESADSTLDLDEESNQGCEDEESKDLASDDRESKEQNTNKYKDFEMTDLDKTSGQSSQTQPDLTENRDKPLDGEVTKKSEDVQESSAIRESSSKEDDQKMSSADEKPDKSITKDEKGQIDAISGRNLWVSGLSSTTRATDLKNLFSKYGKVVGAKVVTNARSPGARCYGFVTMSSSEDATKCINHLHRTELHGRMISVEKAKNEPAGKKPLDKNEIELKKEKSSSSSDRRHSTDKSEKSSPNKKDVSDDGDHGKSTDKDKDDRGSRTSDRSRTSKSGSRGAERTVVMDKSKGEPVVSVKTSSERSSKSQDRKSESKEKREILSFDKIKKQRERERQRQREREIREMERQRERDKRVRERILMTREREERERLRRERARLEFERDRLERERMERERLERERMRIEDERRIEQERIQREREELRRQHERLRYEQDRRSGVRRPYDAELRRDDSYWPESKRMALDDRYEFGRLDRYQDFENRERGRYLDHLHTDRRDDTRSGLGGRNNYPDRHGREYNRHGHEGRGISHPGRDGRDWGDHGRKMDTFPSRPGRGIPVPSGQGHMNRGIHGNFPPNENSQNTPATMGPQGGGNFGGQNRPNDARFTHRY